MTIIYSLNNLVNYTQNTYFDQNSNFIFFKKSITSLSKNKFYLYQKSNDIFNKISNFISIKNQILSLSKIKIYLIKNQILSLSKFYLIFAINYLDIFLTN